MGVKQFFNGSSSEISYGDVRLQPLIFQDDLARMSSSVAAAQEGNDKIEHITNLKQLNINVEKSSYILFGNINAVKKMREIIKLSPLSLNNEVIKEKNSEKYLGDFIHNNGVTESTQHTVNDRYWRVMSSVLEIKTIIEDYRNNHKGGLITGVDLWEMSVIPMLLNNAGTWTNVDTVTTNKLDKLQNTLLRYQHQDQPLFPLSHGNLEFYQ